MHDQLTINVRAKASPPELIGPGEYLVKVVMEMERKPGEWTPVGWTTVVFRPEREAE